MDSIHTSTLINPDASEMAAFLEKQAAQREQAMQEEIKVVLSLDHPPGVDVPNLIQTALDVYNSPKIDQEDRARYKEGFLTQLKTALAIHTALEKYTQDKQKTPLSYTELKTFGKSVYISRDYVLEPRLSLSSHPWIDATRKVTEGAVINSQTPSDEDKLASRAHGLVEDTLKLLSTVESKVDEIIDTDFKQEKEEDEQNFQKNLEKEKAERDRKIQEVVVQYTKKYEEALNKAGDDFDQVARLYKVALVEVAGVHQFYRDVEQERKNPAGEALKNKAFELHEKVGEKLKEIIGKEVLEFLKKDGNNVHSRIEDEAIVNKKKAEVRERYEAAILQFEPKDSELYKVSQNPDRESIKQARETIGTPSKSFQELQAISSIAHIRREADIFADSWEKQYKTIKHIWNWSEKMKVA